MAKKARKDRRKTVERSRKYCIKTEKRLKKTGAEGKKKKKELTLDYYKYFNDYSRATITTLSGTIVK
jgi:hypothetical protein